MSRIAYCTACSMQDNGVNTRIPLKHTCGRERGAISSNQEARLIAHQIMNENGMNYRGSSTNCKACEDEKAGIKHIKAPVHTCGK